MEGGGVDLPVVTKTSLWSAFVLQSCKSGFHIGTICALTSDPPLPFRAGAARELLAYSGDPQRKTFPSPFLF